MNKRGELTKQILVALNMGLIITTAMILPGSAIMFRPFIKKFKTNKQNLIKSLQALKRDRLVDFREDGDISKITITEKGRKKLLPRHIRGVFIFLFYFIFVSISGQRGSRR